MVMMGVTSVRTSEGGIRCGIGVRLVSEGPKEALARWRDAVVEVFDATTADSALARVTFPATEVHDWIGPSIGGGDERTYTLEAAHGIPFHGTVRQSYEVVATGAAAVAEGSFECGPRVLAGALPRLLDSEVVGVPEPGGTLGVRFRTTSDVGLWSVRVHVAGAWSNDEYVAITDEPLDREYEILHHVPTGAVLGSPIYQRVSVTDLAGQTTHIDLDPVTVVDATAPKLSILPHCNVGLGFCPTPTGRTFNIEVTTSDASPHTVTHWVGAPPIVTESHDRPPGWVRDLIMIPATDDLLGRHPFSVTARDALGRESADTLGGELLVYPSQAATVVRSEIAGATTDIRIDTERDALYLAQPGSDHVLVLSLQTLEPIGTIPVTGGPRGVDLTLSGDTLLVALGDQRAVAILDPDGVRAPELYELTALAAGFRAIAVRVAADGSWLVHADRRHTSDGLVDAALVWIEPATGEQVVLESESVGNAWGRLVASGDRTRIAVDVTCLRVWDALARTLGPCSSGRLAELAADHSGSRFADLLWSFDADLGHTRSGHPIGDQVEAVDFTPDGTVQLAAATAGIHVLDAEAWLPLLFLEVDGMPSGRLEVGDGGGIAIAWGIGQVRPVAEATPLARITLEGVLPPAGVAPRR